MSQNHAATIEAYYTALAGKNVSALEKYLHPNVQFLGPFGRATGKEAVLGATTHFANLFKSLKIRTTFSSEDQAMIVYDVDFPEPVGLIRTAALMTFPGEIITKIEVFFDARPFEKMQTVK
ncbi:hypothetical protein PNK_2448 [Candidatus Protochlamydia naegleriophila]|uniref:SnoaL-like domain-containing protein n=1 Tax=Candidatus Protochlamydia naegleriophila TaxID=389348 RepID=A0A0U5JGM9_9BACT|nr:nuclear transport factor 2 family protein [Candidatus Protochlamydia naegleriophila]CUI18042.1 hypothetical protein PNK_2448 [Candidatus Protochlamydia naegleriophila]